MVMLIKFCTLVLRLWYWRLKLEESQVEKILNKDSEPSLKERVGLIREEKKLKKTALLKMQNKQSIEIKSFKMEKKHLQEQYNEICKYIGVKKIKGDIKHKEITDQNKKEIIKEEQKCIELELNKVQSSLLRNQEDVEELRIREEKLIEERKILQTDAKQIDICRKVILYNSINRNYDLKPFIWLCMISCKFIGVFTSKDVVSDDTMISLISFTVFLEWFTNICVLFINDGNLKIALDMLGIHSENSIERTEKFVDFIIIY